MSPLFPPLYFQNTHTKIATTSPARSSAKTPSDMNASRVHKDDPLFDLRAGKPERVPGFFILLCH
jgi:hypothetical protein